MTAVDTIRFLGALLLVLALLLGLAYVLRRWGGRLQALARPPGAGPARLAIVETKSLDPRVRLVLVRRDRCEHLLLLGPTGGQLIETVAPERPTSC